MANVKINTDAVRNVATHMQLMNKQMKDGFSDVQDAMTKLDNSWESSTATMAMEKYNQLRVDFSEARYTVLDNHINFLLQQVGQGYEETEKANVSLAAQFK
ncbi:MAG: hypothetical protein U0L79_09830 [Lachnospiraceae bacterium]|nr:hypothetical protein [Lachnospiraceae bacterium]